MKSNKQIPSSDKQFCGTVNLMSKTTWKIEA